MRTDRPILAIFPSHVFGAELGIRVALGRPHTGTERSAVFVEESRFVLVPVPPLLILRVLALAGVSYTRIIHVIVLFTNPGASGTDPGSLPEAVATQLFVA